MSKIFAMSEAASIAIHSMVLIARNENGINAVKIAQNTGFSKNHISKVLQRMVKSDLLKSVRGPSGGFTLKILPEKVSLLTIYEAIEGPMLITDCPFENEVCHFDRCLMLNVVNKMALEFKRFMDKQTLKDYL
jgi:Rrf2 family protein